MKRRKQTILLKSQILTKTLFLFTCCICIFSSQAQPSIQWQKSLGGSDHDSSNKIIQTLDGGYVVAGYTYSSDGDVTGNLGSPNGWIVKLDSFGAILWQRSAGVGSFNGFNDVEEAANGAFITGGTTLTTVNNLTYSGSWLVKWDKTGQKLWTRNLTFYNSIFHHNNIADFIITPDEGILAIGYYSVGNSLDWDLSLIKLDSSGVIQWHKEFGGTKVDIGERICNTPDGGYLLTGRTDSNDNDVSGNHGSTDIWVLKINPKGDVEWKKCFGGLDTDTPSDVVLTNDGGFIVTGTTASSSGDVLLNHGSTDIWVFKISATGVFLWGRTIGGTKEDNGGSVCNTIDGAYLVAGSVKSTDGDIQNNHGANDCYLVKLDDNGNTMPGKTFGGTQSEAVSSIHPTHDYGYIMCGLSTSADGDLTQNHGAADFWVVKLNGMDFASGTTPNAHSGGSLILYPNPALNQLMLDFSSITTQISVSITNMTGQLLMQKTLPDNKIIDVSSLKSGMYNLMIYSCSQLFYRADFTKI